MARLCHTTNIDITMYVRRSRHAFETIIDLSELYPSELTQMALDWLVHRSKMRSGRNALHSITSSARTSSEEESRRFMGFLPVPVRLNLDLRTRFRFGRWQ